MANRRWFGVDPVEGLYEQDRLVLVSRRQCTLVEAQAAAALTEPRASASGFWEAHIRSPFPPNEANREEEESTPE
jgi:hypothetical protein